MADFDTLLSQIYSLTNRPDLVAETTLALQSATLKAHHLDFFPRDLTETALTFSVPDYVQQLAYSSLWPRFRALKYLRKYDTLGQTAGTEFDIITPEKALDSYKVERYDVCYMAGININIKSSTKDQYMLIGLYQNPDITPLGYNSWIADQHPMAIIFAASLMVFLTIGFQEQAAAYGNLVADEYKLLTTSNLGLAGY